MIIDEVLDLFVRFLTIVGQPFALGQLHMGKDRPERRIFRTAGVDTELNLTFGFMQVADAHLVEPYAIRGTFYAKIILSAAQSIPHGFYLGRDLGGGPIRPTVIGDHAAQMLKLFVLVFYGTFQPVFAVQIQDHAALIEPVAGSKLGFDQEGKILFPSGHLQHRGGVVAEMVVGALPQISVRGRDDLDAVGTDLAFGRFPGPDQARGIKYVHKDRFLSDFAA